MRFRRRVNCDLKRKDDTSVCVSKRRENEIRRKRKKGLIR